MTFACIVDGYGEPRLIIFSTKNQSCMSMIIENSKTATIVTKISETENVSLISQTKNQ